MIRPFAERGGAIFGMVDIDTVRARRDWFIGLGVALVLLGLLAMLLPFFASLVTTIALGWLMIVAGLVEGYHALETRPWAGSGWAFVGAVVQVVAGVLVVLFPVTGKLALTAILAGYFVAEGILKVIRAIQHRRVQASGWLVFDGLITLLLGVMILAHWPGVAVWALGLLVGVNLVVGGSSMLLLALGARSAARA